MVRRFRKKNKFMVILPLQVLLPLFILISMFSLSSPIVASSNKIQIDTDYKVFIYNDKRYPYAWYGSDASSIMLKYLEHLFSEYHIRYDIINADELREVTLNEDPNKSILIFSQDVIPDTVWDGTPSAPIVRWLLNGAKIIWTGSWEFWYIGYENGTLRHTKGMEYIPFGKPVTVVDSVNISISQQGAQYIPSLKKFQARRPFSEDLLQGFYYEVYGYAFVEGVRIIDPGLIGVGSGFFIKIGTTGYHLEALDRALFISELIMNRFFNYTLDLTGGLTYFNSDDSGIVYILPHGVSTPYWSEIYGDRTYFYAYSNVTQYEEYILSDLDTIAERYSFLILILPLEDTELFYYNLKQMDTWATEKEIKILYSFFPKEKYEPEEYYLTIGSTTYNLTIYNMNFMSNLTSTLATSIWYGWKHKPVNVNEIENFYNSLPEHLKEQYYVWVDEPFLETVIDAGLTELTNKFNLTVVTEIYSSRNLALYGFNFNHQIVVTGYWNAKTLDQWLISMKKKLNYVFMENNQFQRRKLGVWIYWDKNDGCNERYNAYVNGILCNPLLTNLTPIASFFISPIALKINDSVNFYDTSEDLDGSIVSQHWDFGDGHTSTNMNPTHNYLEKGSYTVTLMVTDSNNHSDSTTKLVTVRNLPLSDTDDEGERDTMAQDIELVPQTYELTVEVRDFFGFPVNNIEVRLHSNEYDCYDSGFTNTEGKITLFEIPQGEYQIKVTSFGHTTSKTVFLSTHKTEQVRAQLSIHIIDINSWVITFIGIVIRSLFLHRK